MLILLALAAHAADIGNDPLTFPSAPSLDLHLTCAVESSEIGMTGDVMVHGMQLKAAKQPDGTWSMDGLFDAIAPYLSAPDLMMANLETNIAGEDLAGYTGYPVFNSPPTLLEELREAGVDLLQTTNNHTLDRGELGNERTIDAVEAHGFLRTGSYRSLAERRTPQAMATLPNGAKVAVIAYTYGAVPRPPPERWWRVSYIDQNLFQQDIAAARAAGADLVVVGLHWGLEYRHQPEDHMVELAHELVALGADVVWGTHPHVLQPAEVVTIEEGSGSRDGLVLYSLGNMVSNQRTPNRDGGVIVRAEVLHCPRHDQTWLGQVRFTPIWVDDRTADGRLHFRVVPALPEGVPCGGGDLSAADCANLQRFRAHAEQIFPPEQTDDGLEPPEHAWVSLRSLVP